jgi:hypothetical protein
MRMGWIGWVLMAVGTGRVMEAMGLIVEGTRRRREVMEGMGDVVGGVAGSECQRAQCGR